MHARRYCTHRDMLCFTNVLLMPAGQAVNAQPVPNTWRQVASFPQMTCFGGYWAQEGNWNLEHAGFGTFKDPILVGPLDRGPQKSSLEKRPLAFAAFKPFLGKKTKRSRPAPRSHRGQKKGVEPQNKQHAEHRARAQRKTH